MQKVKTTEYEFLARLLTNRPLFEIQWNNRVYISYIKELVYHYYCREDMLQLDSYEYIVANAHTVRGAWKKACKNLNSNQ